MRGWRKEVKETFPVPPLPSPLCSSPYVGSKIIIATETKHPSHRAALLPIKLTDVATSLQITDHYVSLK